MARIKLSNKMVCITFKEKEPELPCREEGESLSDFKNRLSAMVRSFRIQAEDAFDCYEEAVLKDVEAI